MKDWQKFHNWRDSVDKVLGSDFFKDFEYMFEDQTPRVNVYESDYAIICLVALPGLKDLSDIDVFIDYRTLTVKGSVTYAFKGFRLRQEELFQGPFERVVELPFPVESEPIDAAYKSGFLYLHLQRQNNHRQTNPVKIKNLEIKK